MMGKYYIITGVNIKMEYFNIPVRLLLGIAVVPFCTVNVPGSFKLSTGGGRLTPGGCHAPETLLLHPHADFGWQIVSP